MKEQIYQGAEHYFDTRRGGDRLVYSVTNMLCPSAQARRVLRHGGLYRCLREGQGQVPSIPDHCDWLLGQLQPQLHRLRRLGGGHQAPVLRGGSGDLRLRK